MKVISQYIAEDGTIFEFESDCIQYERKLKLKKYLGDILLLDYDGEKIDNPVREADRICYIYIRTDDAAECLEEVIRGIYLPWDCEGNEPHAGAWAWDNDSDRWISLEELRSLLDNIEKYSPSWEEPGL